MTTAPFQADPATPPQLVGLTLDDGEPSASIHGLSRAMQIALLQMLDLDRLDYRGRLGWHHPNCRARSEHSGIGQATIHALVDRGLAKIVSRSRFRKHARITSRGRWYARTINSALMHRLKEINP